MRGNRTAGRLVYLMGASGSGKDSLLRYARQHLSADSRIVFAHRYITRPAELEGENHIALNVDEFQRRQRSGLFSLVWQSHGFHYGVGIEIESWLKAGQTVVVNGSREYLPQALALYPSMLPVLVLASPRLLKERLQRRQRESAAQIDVRLQRNEWLDVSGFESVTVLPNEGSLQQAGTHFLRLLESELPRAS